MWSSDVAITVETMTHRINDYTTSVSTYRKLIATNGNAVQTRNEKMTQSVTDIYCAELSGKEDIDSRELSAGRI